jgi:MSHA biogenesis protein MshL
MVGTEGGRSVVFNAESGLIAVRANPRELRDVQQFLDKIQDIASRQVIIEAKIVEVELSSAFRAGINWAAIAEQGNRTISGFQTGPQQGFGSNNLLSQPSVPVTVGPGNPVTSMLTNSLGGAFTLAVNAGSFNAYVELLATQGKTRVLSSPRVSTINNQKASSRQATMSISSPECRATRWSASARRPRAIWNLRRSSPALRSM